MGLTYYSQSEGSFSIKMLSGFVEILNKNLELVKVVSKSKNQRLCSLSLERASGSMVRKLSLPDGEDGFHKVSLTTLFGWKIALHLSPNSFRMIQRRAKSCGCVKVCFDYLLRYNGRSLFAIAKANFAKSTKPNSAMRHLSVLMVS